MAKKQRVPAVRKREVTMRLWDGMMARFVELERRVQKLERDSHTHAESDVDVLAERVSPSEAEE